MRVISWFLAHFLLELPSEKALGTFEASISSSTQLRGGLFINVSWCSEKNISIFMFSICLKNIHLIIDTLTVIKSEIPCIIINTVFSIKTRSQHKYTLPWPGCYDAWNRYVHDHLKFYGIYFDLLVTCHMTWFCWYQSHLQSKKSLSECWVVGRAFVTFNLSRLIL